MGERGEGAQRGVLEGAAGERGGSAGEPDGGGAVGAGEPGDVEAVDGQVPRTGEGGVGGSGGERSAEEAAWLLDSRGEGEGGEEGERARPGEGKI